MTDSAVSPQMRLAGEQVYSPLNSSVSTGELEARLLHKFLVALDVPSNWPGWLVGVAALMPITAAAGIWGWLFGTPWAFRVVIVLSMFTLADVLTLVSLPRRQISFGPIGPQLFTLEIPRLSLAVLAAGVGGWLGPLAALMGTMLINLAGSLALAWGALIEPQRLGVSHLSLSGGSWRQGIPPLRLLHITDLHVERFGCREKQLLQMVQATAPDLILLSGDYVNLSYVDDPIAHADARRLLESLSTYAANHTPGGLYAVLGSPPVDRNSIPLFDDLPLRLLRDEVVTLDLGYGRRLALLGLDCSHNLERDAGTLAAVAAQTPTDVFRILLYHSPELALLAPEFDIKLYVCGHTHGGQVRLPGYGALLTSSKLGKQFEMGYYQWRGTHVYVSRGVGLEGMGAPRVRFLCPPEVVLCSLNGRSLNRAEDL